PGSLSGSARYRSACLSISRSPGARPVSELVLDTTAASSATGSPHPVRSWRHANRPWQNQLVHIRLLGPFEVRTDVGGFADVPGARSRGLLNALALGPGHVVPKATLVDWIWGERPPSDAANALQRLASRLRKALPTGSIEGQPGGYRLAVAPDAVD